MFFFFFSKLFSRKIFIYNTEWTEVFMYYDFQKLNHMKCIYFSHRLYNWPFLTSFDVYFKYCFYYSCLLMFNLILRVVIIVYLKKFLLQLLIHGNWTGTNQNQEDIYFLAKREDVDPEVYSNLRQVNSNSCWNHLPL